MYMHRLLKRLNTNLNQKLQTPHIDTIRNIQSTVLVRIKETHQ